MFVLLEANTIIPREIKGFACWFTILFSSPPPPFTCQNLGTGLNLAKTYKGLATLLFGLSTLCNH